jgi:hypothetical protein
MTTTQAPATFPTEWTPAVAAALAAPFAEDLIGWKPKPSKAERDADARPADCQVCGGWHKPCRVHVPFLGHALVTERLNAVVGPNGWSWTLVDLVRDDRGALQLVVGEMTVLGHTKGPEVGAPGDLPAGPGDAFKGAISDYISQAAARFGVGLYLKARRLESGAERPQAGALTAGRMRAEQAEATRTRSRSSSPRSVGPDGGPPEQRTGRDALRDLRLSANDAACILREEAPSDFKGITFQEAMRLTGEPLAKAEAYWRAAQQRDGSDAA